MIDGDAWLVPPSVRRWKDGLLEGRMICSATVEKATTMINIRSALDEWDQLLLPVTRMVHPRESAQNGPRRINGKVRRRSAHSILVRFDAVRCRGGSFAFRA